MTWRDLLYTATGRVRSGWRALIFMAIALPLANLLVAVFAVPLVSVGFKFAKTPLLDALVFGLATIPAFLGAGSWAAATFERFSSRTLGMPLDEPWLAKLLGGFLGGIVVILCFLALLRAVGLATFSGHIPTAREWSVLGFLALSLLVGSAGTILLAHGYAFQTLLRGVGITAALLISSAFFVLQPLLTSGDPTKYLRHLTGNPLLYVTIFLTCLTLGMLYLRSGSLWLPIGLNAGWNFGLALFHLPLGMAQPIVPTPLQATLTGDPRLIGSALGPESGALAALVQLLLLAGVMLAPRGLALATRWWEWRELLAPSSAPRAWDFSIGARQYQWRLMVPEDSE